MRKFFTFIMGFNILLAQGLIPGAFKMNAEEFDPSAYRGLKSNMISDIVPQEDSLVWLGTGSGLAVLRDKNNIYTITTKADATAGQLTNMVPAGGVVALAVHKKTLFAAFAKSGEDITIGNGLVYSTDATGNSIDYTYFDQPIDTDADRLAPFAKRFFEALPITVKEANVTYDAAISGNYIWITSWAGGLRRYNILQKVWERVPLPMDGDQVLNTCESASYENTSNGYVLKDYYLNPRDPWDGASTKSEDPKTYGNHNHKAFSVLSYSDTIWVGTANGINRGIFGSGNCIDWKHYSYPMDNLSGNFVVGLEIQRLNGKRIIWAATVNADDPTEQRGLSFTIDDGLSWNTALLGERIYNIAAFDSLVFAASANGVWKTDDGINWALYKPARQAIPIPNTAIYDLDEVLADEVYSVAFDNRSYYGDRSIWIGTGDGAAHSYDLDGLNWRIFRAEYDINEDYAYPNPFSPYTHNVLNDNGYVRFHTNEWSGTFVIDIDVYNFAMEKVYAESFDKRIASSGTLKWDGRDQQGVIVHNGVYFIKLTYPDNQSSKPSPHWVKLIVVK